MVREYGYEYNAILNQKLWNETEGKCTDKKLWDAYCLRSGRDALKVIAREYANSTVFLPSLCCDSMILPFEMYGCTIQFYRLDDGLHADMSSVFEKLRGQTGKVVLLYSDYFGIQMIPNSFLSCLKRNYRDLILVRDITHNLLTFKKADTIADFTIASLRKWCNIPDGGLLWAKCDLKNNHFCEDVYFSKKRLQAQCLRTEFFSTGKIEIKEKYRSIFSGVSAILDSSKEPAKMTEYAYRLAMDTNWNDIQKRREENAQVLLEMLNKVNEVKIIQPYIGESDLYVPFLVENRDIVQCNLSKIGIFNTIIWPLRDRQKEGCKVSAYIEKHMLAAPCDQRYSKEDMKYIGIEIERLVHG